MKIIKGSTSPKAEEKTFYEITGLIPSFDNPLFRPKEEIKYTWTLFKKQKGVWKQVANNLKHGRKVPYTFGEKVVGIPYKIEVHEEGENLLNKVESKLTNSLIITPRTSKEPIIGRVILLNKNNSNVNKATFNEHLTAQARTSNLLGKEIIFYLWEEGALEPDKYKKPKIGRVNENGIAEVQFNLSEYASQETWMSFFSSNSNATKKFFVTAEYNTTTATNKGAVTVSDQPKEQPIPKNPDNGALGIITKTTNVIAEGIGGIGDFLKDSTKTATSIGQTQTQQPTEGKCPRCTKLTDEELKAVFPSVTNSALITEIVNSFNKYCEKFNVNTCNLKAHFFAQAKQESGDSLNPAIDGENMNYNIGALKTTGFLNVSSEYKFGHKNGLEMANDLGRKVGEIPLNIDKQINVANFVYGLNPKARTLGNKAPTDNLSLSENDNEGWRFRGRGMLQITGRNNYTDIEAHVNKVLASQILNIKEGRKSTGKFTATEALLSGLGDWDLHKMYNPAKVGVTKQACLNVIKIINSKTKSKTKRVAHLLGGDWYVDDKTTGSSHTIKEKDSMISIFRVKDCKLLNPVDDAVQSDNSGILEEMKKIVDQHIPYSQSGVRNELNDEGLKNLDCSETVGIYLHKLGVMPAYKAIDTSTMTTERNFRSTIGTDNIDLVPGSDKRDFKPQRGDVFVWRKGTAGPGHTGIIYHYDEATDVVTILEAIGSVGAVSENDQVKNGGYSGTGNSRTGKYSRLKGALYGHKGWAGYFRPKNYTKKL